MKRRILLVGLTVLAVLLGTAGTAAADTGIVNEPWVRFPQVGFERGAGENCAFALRLEIVEDEVMSKVVQRFPSGSIERQLAAGKLITRVVNLSSGASTLVDAGGSAVFEYNEDGTFKSWFVVGPIIALPREGVSNLGRGVWGLDGIYKLEFRPGPFIQFTGIHHFTKHDVCADID
jgi:hypothetical protein